jgi:thiamine-monophosphate kinase
MQEFDIINNYFKKLARTKESLELKDDTALILASNYKKVITLDTIVEGTHFFNLDNPKSIATKLLETNLSDISSMGANPKYWLFSISFPKNRNVINKDWLDKFTNTLLNIQKKYNFFLIGGDTTSTNDKLVLSATMIGYLKPSENPLLKSGAKEGDIICVGGPIGDSFIGYNLLSNELEQKQINIFDITSKLNKQYFINKYLYPKAQVDMGKILVKYANSCTDISDGLVADLEKICNFSNKQGVIYLDKIPFSVNAKKLLCTQEKKLSAITWGDDYKLVFTLSSKNLLNLNKYLLKLNLRIYPIGHIKKRSNINNLILLDSNNNEIKINQKGFKHFF